MNQNYLQGDERIDQLYSQDIKIIQSPSVFSFSLDAVMLADFAKPKMKAGSMTVDLCAGNGAVGLFCAHKTRGRIAEVEIQPKLADMAKRSVSLNHLDDQMSVYQMDLKDAPEKFGSDSVDTVLVNPPYFLNTETSRKNPNQYLAIARHEIKTNLKEVVETAASLLKFGGKLFMVYRPDRLLELLRLLPESNLAPKHLKFVYPKKDRDANMVLISAIKAGNNAGLKSDYPLTIYEGNHYTKAVREMLYGS